MTRTFALIAAALSIAAAAHAAPDADQPHMTVKYSDLNLAGPSGVATLYARIQTASAIACASVGDDRTLGGLSQNKACREQMVTEGVRSMNLKPLAEFARGGVEAIQVATH